MADRGEKIEDFYSVLGLKKECTVSELKTAYKKLALRWHPDRCSSSGNLKFIEESKKKFQAIQEAYSVLSNESKRFMYDLGFYENDEEENEMGDFLGEMVDLMAQTKPNNAKAESFEDLQVLFEEMVQANLQCSNLASQTPLSNGSSNNNSKQNCTDSRNGEFRPPESNAQSFCLGAEGRVEDKRGRGGSWRRTGKQQKVSARQSMSSPRDSKNLGIRT